MVNLTIIGFWTDVGMMIRKFESGHALVISGWPGKAEDGV